MNKGPDPSETFAKAVLDAAMPTRSHELIAEQSHGEPDILVSNASDGVKYVEVTECTEPGSRAWSTDQARGPLRCPDLQGNWQVSLKEAKRLDDRLRDKICLALQEAEKAMVDFIDPVRGTGFSSLDEMLKGIPIDICTRTGMDGEGRVHLNHPVLASLKDLSGPLISALEKSIERKATKLERLHGQIELFVIVDYFRIDAFSAFDTGTTFSNLDTRGARRIWVSSIWSSGESGKVLCFEPDNGWSSHSFNYSDLSH